MNEMISNVIGCFCLIIWRYKNSHEVLQSSIETCKYSVGWYNLVQTWNKVVTELWENYGMKTYNLIFCFSRQTTFTWWTHLNTDLWKLQIGNLPKRKCPSNRCTHGNGKKKIKVICHRGAGLQAPSLPPCLTRQAPQRPCKMCESICSVAVRSQ